MITGGDLAAVVTAMVPLYVAMGLGYGSVRWWGVFSGEQCAGINKFVAVFAVPLLSLWFIAGNDPYKMDREFLVADGLSKLVALCVLGASMVLLWRIGRRRELFGGGLDWVITGYSLATLPNTLIMGVPLLDAMYGSHYSQLMVQIVVFQSILWYTLLLFLFELRAATSRPPPTSSRPSSPPHIVTPLSNIIITTQDGLQEVVSPTGKARLPEVVIPQEVQVEARVLNGLVVESNHEIVEILPGGGHGSESKLRAANVLKVVAWKLARNPNTYATIVGILWSLIAFNHLFFSCRYNLQMPKIVQKSIEILSQAGLGMAMFSLGLFMALQPRLIPCGARLCALAMVLRFLVGPMLMAVSSLVIGLRGVQLRAAIVQAALPQGIVPFVFAREYNLHPDILSTAVIFGMLVALPTMLLYYFLLEI